MHYVTPSSCLLMGLVASYFSCGGDRFHIHSNSGGMATASGGTEGESGAPNARTDQGGNSGKGGENAGGSTGSGGGDAGAGGGASQCDTTKSPRDEGCLVSDDFAVFVSPDGDDKNDGTQAAPLLR
jgi:hypothetical protein